MALYKYVCYYYYYDWEPSAFYYWPSLLHATVCKFRIGSTRLLNRPTSASPVGEGSALLFRLRHFSGKRCVARVPTCSRVSANHWSASCHVLIVSSHPSPHTDRETQRERRSQTDRETDIETHRVAAKCIYHARRHVALRFVSGVQHLRSGDIDTRHVYSAFISDPLQHLCAYDTIRDAILTCARKPTCQLNLPHGTDN